jgi:hypothetical protein
MRNSIAATVGRKVARAKPGTFLRVSELAKDERSRHAVEHALSRLAASDAPVVRARKGLYYRGVESRFGKTRPRPLDVALEVAGPHGAGPAGWTALRTLGITTQLPAIDEVAVIGAPPAEIHGIRFHVRRNPDRLRLTIDEIAALEAIRAWPTHGDRESGDLSNAIRALVATGRIRSDRLANAAGREPPDVRATVRSILAASAA